MAAPSTATTQLSGSMRGILWMLFAAFFMCSSDPMTKYLVQNYPVPFVMWGRYAFFTLAVILVFRGRIWSLAKTERPFLQSGRSLLHVVFVAFFNAGLIFLPIADANAILFATPLIITALSVPLLGERVGLHRWGAVVVGFGGALLIIRPGTDAFRLAALLPLAAAFTTAFYQIATRHLSRTDAAFTTIIYTAVVGFITMCFVVPFYWSTPDATGWAFLAAIGVIGAVGQFGMIKAYEAARAATVAPYFYTLLVWAIIYGYLFFNELPDEWTLAGALIIVASGLYILRRERLREAMPTPARP